MLIARRSLVRIDLLFSKVIRVDAFIIQCFASGTKLYYDHKGGESSSHPQKNIIKKKSHLIYNKYGKCHIMEFEKGHKGYFGCGHRGHELIHYLVVSTRGREVLQYAKLISLTTSPSHPNQKGTSLSINYCQQTHFYLSSNPPNINGSPKDESGMFLDFLLHALIVIKPYSSKMVNSYSLA